MVVLPVTSSNAVLSNRTYPTPCPLIGQFPCGIRPFTGRSLASNRSRSAIGRLQNRPILRAVALSEAATFTSETNKAANPLRIVFVSAEVGPWSKTGGLGDVVGGLPIALAQRGHKVLTIAPR